MEHSIQACGKNYFHDPDFPIAVQMICSDTREQHRFDFTSVDHFHDFSEIVLVCSGSGIQNIDGHEFPVESGDIFLLNGYTEHYFSKRENLVLCNLQFDAEKLPMPEHFLRRLPGYNLFFLLEPRMRKNPAYRKKLHVSSAECRKLQEEFRKLNEILTGEKPGFEAVAFAGFLNIVIALAQLYPPENEETNPAFCRLSKIISLLENSYATPWSLPELAKRACMSVNHFLRLFHEATGTSPLAYLTTVRLRHGAELLEKTELSLSEIAARCGLCDSNYFCKLFRKYYRTTPRQYRLGRQNSSAKPEKIALMLGGNLGDPATVFQEACCKLQKHGVKNLRCSSVFISAAVDCVPGTPDFSDAAVTGEWAGSPEELLQLCQKLEQEAGRPAVHSSRESRILDIDVILFGNRVIRTPELTIPHPRASIRKFVLEPLCELAPELIFPDSGLSVQETLKFLCFQD